MESENKIEDEQNAAHNVYTLQVKEKTSRAAFSKNDLAHTCDAAAVSFLFLVNVCLHFFFIFSFCISLSQVWKIIQ